MKVKTSELSGVQLDYATAISTGTWSEGYLERNRNVIPRYSTDWSQCGPLIEEFDLVLNRITPSNEYWRASPHKSWSSGIDKDPKIAICRAVVAAKLGDEVDIPDELMESK